MRELSYGMTPSVLIAAASYDDDNTPVAIDLAGYDGATISLAVGVGGITFTSTNKIEFVCEVSNNNTDWSNAVTADFIGVTLTSGIIRSLTAAKAAADVVNYRYVGTARYIRLTANFGGSHASPTPIAATLLRGNPTQPVTA